MASKLGEGLWSSKFILPEHAAALADFEKELHRKERKNLDSQELEQINRALQQSMQHRVPITIYMYDPYEELEVVGVVANISKLRGQFKVGDDWFIIEDIEGVEEYETFI